MSTLRSGRFTLTITVLKNCIFRKTNLFNINNRYCFAYTSPSSFLYSHASAFGCVSVIGFNNEYVCHRMWTDSESLQSSTWRELCPIEFSLKSFAQLMFLKYHMSSGLLIIKLLPELLKFVE